MQKIILILFLACVTTLSFAQWNFDKPGPFTESSTTDDIEVSFSNDVISTGAFGNYRWMLVPTFQSGWGAYVCDKNLCWPEGVYTADFMFAPGDTATLDTKFLSNGVAGNGSFDMYVYQINDSINTVKIANHNLSVAMGTGTGIEDVIADKINIYPNPAKEILNVDAKDLNLNEIEIISVIGELVVKTNEVNTSIDVGHLDSGLFMVRFFDNDRQILATKTFTKL